MIKEQRVYYRFDYNIAAILYMADGCWMRKVVTVIWDTAFRDEVEINTRRALSRKEHPGGKYTGHNSESPPLVTMTGTTVHQYVKKLINVDVDLLYLCYSCCMQKFTQYILGHPYVKNGKRLGCLHKLQRVKNVKNVRVIGIEIMFSDNLQKIEEKECRTSY
ncbi:hypothetical protein BDA99DRAFT_533407 [Phascolomyces articulosus]|uniref:Uncharacterized protein n=1 Tax=Phascolomyces articulosus TaxID=60185 RepID=A0AAD5K8Y4_9FUNG|nr:hypothetical protein BDA99DRAFT_533407 [Phascolomyces articulosus]